jgi:hypothetical protein
MDEVSNFSPAMAVPITVKMPEPMTAPMPSAVREMGPSVFFSACSGHSESLISLSMDLRAKSCDRVTTPAEGSGQREHAGRVSLP